MLTPKKRDNLAHLQEQMSEIETVLRRLNRRLKILLNQLERTAAPPGEERFEQPEVARLMTLNPHLAKLEQHLRDQALALMAETRILADGMDHRESGRTDMAQLDGEPHCWLFHDLYDHSYGFSKPCVPLRDCLRIGKVWVDVVIRQQYCLDIAHRLCS